MDSDAFVFLDAIFKCRIMPRPHCCWRTALANIKESARKLEACTRKQRLQRPARKHQGNKPWNCELFANKQRGFDAVCVGEQLANCSRTVLSIVDPALEANAVRTSCYVTHLC
ncbi:hypothetical protein K0M31_001300 [Melipona bicolor]|uniref:Uncharacterized protein n=1 Tax=Melipona bicolor TaxID=60889 RepID=A0AA40GF95_9HYME|nr:hypothetical protein K0M31_001300 [Melipona bicolor]